jgi:hypothetical protein
MSFFLLFCYYPSASENKRSSQKFSMEPEEDAGEMRFKLVEKKTTKHH